MTMLRVPPAVCANCATGKIGFCAGLLPQDMARIANISKPASYRKLQRIENGSDAHMTALIIRRGTVKLSHTLTDGRHQIIDFLQAGDIAIRQTSESRLRGSLEASTDVDVCQIEFGDLEDLCNYSPEINRSVIGASLAQIDRKNSQVLVLGRKRAGERVASFLLDMSERAARRGEPPLSVELPMSRAEIADYLSLTTETVSRAFSQLRERAVVDLPKPHEVLVLDIAALREISDGGSDLSVR